MSDPAAPIPPDALLRHSAFVRRVARSLVADDATADDVAQEAMLTALQSPPRSVDALTTWLERVVRRAASRLGRGSARRRVREAESARKDDVPSVVDGLGRASVLREINDAVLSLREPYRSTVYLRFYEQRSVADIARDAGAPVSTIESRLRRALAMLRDRLDDPRVHGDWRAVVAPLVPAGLLKRAHHASHASIPAAAAASGTLLMSSQLKWGAACAVSVVSLVALWNVGSHDTVERSAAEPEVARSEGPALATVSNDDDRTNVDVARDDGPAKAAEPDHVVDAPASTTGSLRVHVEYADGEPAPGRTISALPWTGGNAFADQVTFVTDERGDAHLAEIEAGSVLFYVDIGGGGRVDVAAGEETFETVVIPLGVTLTGRVLDGDGATVAGADVWLSDYGTDTEGTVVAKSDANGAFTLRHIPSGRRISAVRDGYDPSRLRRIEGAPGSDVRMDLRLRPGGARISGSVRDFAGAVPPRARLRYLPEDPGETSGSSGEPEVGLPAYDAPIAPDGTFVIAGLPVGRGRFYVRADGCAPYAESLDLEAGDALRRDVALLREGVVRGVVRDESGTPVAGARLMAGDYAAPDFSLVTSGAGGAYRLDGLPHGEVEVLVEHDDLGRASRRLVISSGDPVAWDPVLDRGRVLTGIVVDAEGVALAGWFVDVRGERPIPGERRFWSEQRRTDAGGRFEFPGCPEGEIFIELRSPDYPRNPIASRGGVLAGDGEQRFVIDEADRPSAFVLGRVRDADGAPVIGEVYVVRTTKEGVRFRLFESLDDGRFELGPLLAGRYSIRVDPTNAPAKPLREFEVDAEQRLDLGLLELPRPATLRFDADEAGAFDELQVVPVGSSGSKYPLLFRDPIGQDIALWEGEYRWRLRGPGSAPIVGDVTLQAGERDARRVDVVPGRECVLRATIGEGEPEPSFLSIGVVRDERSYASWGIVQPAASDHTVRATLVPGTYRVVARTPSGLAWDGDVTVESGSGEQAIVLPLRRE